MYHDHQEVGKGMCHGIICYSQHLEIIQISVSSRTNNISHSTLYGGVVYCNEKEETTAVINRVAEFHQTMMNERQQMQI